MVETRKKEEKSEPSKSAKANDEDKELAVMASTAASLNKSAKSNESMLRIAKLRMMLLVMFVGTFIWFVYRTKQSVESHFSGFIDFLKKANDQRADPFKTALCLEYPIFSRVWFTNKNTPITLYYAYASVEFNRQMELDPSGEVAAIIAASNTSDGSAKEVLCRHFKKSADFCKEHCEPTFIQTSTAGIVNDAFMGGAIAAFGGSMLPGGGPVIALAALAGAAIPTFNSFQKQSQEKEQCEAKKKNCINKEIVRCDG